MKLKMPVAAWLPVAVCFLTLHHVTQAESGYVCYSESCNKTADIFLPWMNRSADPCNDFFNYTCGIEQMYAIGRKNGVLTYLHNNYDEEAMNLIKQIKLDDPFKPFQLLKKYFNSASDISVSKQRKTFSTIISKLIDVNSDRNAKFDWTKIIKILTDNGKIDSFLINFIVEENPTRNSQKIIMLKQAGLTTGFHTKKIRKIFIERGGVSYVKELLTDLNITVNERIINLLHNTIFRQLFDFEDKMIEIAKLAPRESQVEITIKNLSMNAPEIPWLSFVQTVVGNLSNIAIDENEIVLIPSVEYMKNLEQLISNTSESVLLIYIAYNIHISYSYDMYLYKSKTRSRNFILDDFRLKDITTVLFAKAMMPEVRNYTLSLSERIREELLEKINSEWDWMDEQTKNQAVEKLRSLSVVVGYKDLKAEMEKIERYYDSLNFNDDGYWAIKLQVAKFKLKRSIEMLHKSVDNFTMISTQTMGTDYDAVHNVIYVFAGTLQNIVVSIDRPEYLNIVMIGADIAEFMSSAIVGKNRIYDSHGNLRDWWSDSSKMHYDAVVRCFKNHYGNFSRGEVKLDDEDALSEVLSVNLGHQILHRMFRKWRHAAKESAWKLPNYNETLDQMYFTVAASGYCDHASDNIPTKFKFQGIGSNMAEFGRAFSCQQGTTMNPKQKCEF